MLFIAVDDLRPQLGVYGHNDTLTPHLDQFGKTALVFTNAHAQIAHCSPSRNSLMSGRTPDHIQVWNFIDDFRDPSVGGLQTVTLPEYFRVHGYFATGAGKVFHPGKPKNNDQHYSWSEPYGSASLGQCRSFNGGHPSNYACDADMTNITDPRVADNAVAAWALSKLAEFAAANTTAAHGTPFFVAAGIHKPHLPYFYPPEFGTRYPPVDSTPIPPAEALATPTGMPPIAWMACMGVHGEEQNFDDFNAFNLTQPADPDPGPGPPVAPTDLVKNITRGYMASVSYVDSQVGLMLASLEEHALADDTVVVVWGDHGQNLGEHNTYCKMTLFESATRVPLMIRAPHTAATSAGRFTDSPAQLLDMYPTLAALAGLPAPSHVDGVDLSSLFGEPTRTDVSAGAFSQQARCYQKDASTPHPTLLQASLTRMMTCEFVDRGTMDFMGYSVRTREWRYTTWLKWNGHALAPLWNTTVGTELYDHRASTMPTHGHSGWRENDNLAYDPQRVRNPHFENTCPMRYELAQCNSAASYSASGARSGMPMDL